MLFPTHLIPQRAEVVPVGAEVLEIESAEGIVQSWFLPGQNVSPDAPGGAVIFAHGNGELIDDYSDYFEPYRQRGISVMLVEYRGYGRSAGRPSEKAITADFTAFYELLRNRPEVDADRIVMHGRSLGAGAVCALADKHEPAAMILQSAFTSVPDVVDLWWLPRFFIRNQFDNRKVIEQLRCPILILHGQGDTIIPYHHAQALHATALHSTLIGFDADHNDVMPAERYWNAIGEFLETSGIVEQKGVSSQP